MTISRLPPPAALGLPADKFPMWRPRQEQMIWDCFESEKRFIAIVAPTGAGKCHPAGTKVLLASGATRNVENLRRGDLLLGPDSLPREVQATFSGFGLLYTLQPVKGAAWGLNINHVLTLVKTQEARNESISTPIDVPLRDWLQWSPWRKHIYKLVRTGVTFPTTYNLPLEPYFLGVILGDGSLDRVAVTKPDPEILSEVTRQAQMFGLRVRSEIHYSGCPTHHIVGKSSRWYKNPIMSHLENLRLRGVRCEDRFIPKAYLWAHTAARLDLLAGLLDTDGHYCTGGTYDFISKSKALADDITYLARSLGFAAYATECTKGCQDGFSGKYHRVSISGNLSEIPCRIPRKRAQPRQQVKDVLRTGFKVSPAQKGEFFGCQLDGDGRYLLDDFTVTHNSAVYAAYTALNGDRCVVLTSTKSLQTQLIGDFESMQWRDVRGQSNYVCRLDAPHTVAEGPCHAGISCDLRRAGCHYYDAIRAARKANVAQTNYSFWMTHATTQEFGDSGIGKFDTVICDEAHSAPDELGKYLSVHVSNADCRNYLGGARPPADKWRIWAQQVVRYAEERLADYSHVSERDHHTISRVRRIKDLIRKLQALGAAERESDWVQETTFFRGKSTGTRWDPIWPGPYAEKLLFQGARRVIFISATIRPKTLELLGLKPDDYDFREYPSDFPVARRPIIYVPTVPVTWRTSPAMMLHWHKQIDAIVAARADRKGLIHTVSYARQKAIVEGSVHRRRMLTHVPANDFTDPNANTQSAALEIFRKAAPSSGWVLVSPSITTGLDFPGEQAEYQIITKVPFPDQRSKILKVRSKGDREYPFYLAMMDLVQACGRIMRFREDRGETLVIDNNFSWFIWKYRKFAPKWFLAAIRRLPPVMDAVTPPPKPPITLRAERALKPRR